MDRPRLEASASAGADIASQVPITPLAKVCHGLIFGWCSPVLKRVSKGRPESASQRRRRLPRASASC
jgi:hypothetical protein